MKHDDLEPEEETPKEEFLSDHKTREEEGSSVNNPIVVNDETESEDEEVVVAGVVPAIPTKTEELSHPKEHVKLVDIDEDMKQEMKAMVPKEREMMLALASLETQEEWEKTMTKV